MIVDGERVKEALGIKGATKYGPTRDYSTRMAYEIVDAIDDSVIPESELQREQIRPKGKWIDKEDYAECSICGAHSGVQYDGVQPVSLKTKYCPYCGAEMEKEE